MNIARHTRALSVAALLAFAVLLSGIALVACGDDEEVSSGRAATSDATAGNGIDRAFVADMIPHHESAVDMAKIAQRRGQSAFVTELADDIIRTQKAEITTMEGIASTLDAAGAKATSLGVPEHQKGMHADLEKLRTADPFDRAFIDMMVPHHQGAIRMARAELAKGSSPRAKRLAEEIIAGQSREIRAMNDHRTEALGSPSPAGGVPPPDGRHGKKGSGGHGGEESSGAHSGSGDLPRSDR